MTDHGRHEDATLSAAGSSWPFGKTWALGTANHAIHVFVATLLALLGGGTLGLDLVHVDWLHALSIAGGAVVLSVLTSAGSAFVGERGTASLLPGGQ